MNPLLSCRSLLGVLAVLLCAYAAPAAAQASLTHLSAVTAQVIEGVQIDTVQPLRFEALVAGTIAAIPTRSAEAGKVQITGQPNTALYVSFIPPTLLLPAPGAAGSVSFTSETPAYKSEDTPAAATSFASATGGESVIGPSGELFLFFGGSADAGLADSGLADTGLAQAQSYTARYDIVITYLDY